MRTWTAVRIDTQITIEVRSDLTTAAEGDVQIIDIITEDIRAIRVCHAYHWTRPNAQTMGAAPVRPARILHWDSILAGRDIILAGDFNTHSPIWNPLCHERRRATFLEDLIEKH